MNVDKIKGGLGFNFIRIDHGDSIVFPEKKTLMTFEESPWCKYKKQVWAITNTVCHLIPNIEKRGFKDHHIDHIISIWRGFKTGVPAEKIGGLSNLRMLPYLENMAKGIR